MAMTMSGEAVLPAAREVVWARLNDAEVLKACIPGCEQLVKEDDTHLSAVVKVKLGPVKASFKGKVELSELDPPNGYRIAGEGEGGIAGFAKGGARVALSDAEAGGTLLRYEVEAQVGGKLVQLGSRLIDSVSKKLADEFFANFARAVAEG
jgi:carbon monoxide dehydrogenase subunit G